MKWKIILIFIGIGVLIAGGLITLDRMEIINLQDILPTQLKEVSAQFTGGNETNGQIIFSPYNQEGYDFVSNGSSYKFYIKNNSNFGDGVKVCISPYCFIYQSSDMSYRDSVGSQDYISSINGVTGKPSANVWTYPNVFSNTNLTYQILNNQIKENYVLGSLPRSPAGFLGSDITLDFGGYIKYGNLSVYVNDTNIANQNFVTYERIDFKDSNNNIVFSLPKPYAYDSAGNKINIRYEVKKQGGDIWFYVRTPYSWLNDTSRVFPVYIDPTWDFLQSFITSGFNQVGGLFEDLGFLYVNDFGGTQTVRRIWVNGTTDTSWTIVSGKGTGTRGLTGNETYLWFTDFTNDEVWRYYLNKTEAGSFDTSGSGESESFVSIYNFSDTTNNKAFKESPAGSNRFLAGTEATSTEYTNMQTNNNVYADSIADATNDEPFWRFTFKINESVSLINNFTIRFNGYENAGEAGNPYVFNWTANVWVDTGTIPKSDDWQNFTITNSNVANFIGANGNITLAYEGANFDSPSDAVRTDYVEIEVTYTTGTVPNNIFPHGICTDNNEIWVTDSGNGFNYKYFMNGTYTGTNFNFSASIGHGNLKGTDCILNKVVSPKEMWVIADNRSIYQIWTNGTYQQNTIDKGAFGWGANNGTFIWLSNNLFPNGNITRFEGFPSVDTTSPQWSQNTTNGTTQGAFIQHSVKWTDETALSGYIFSFDNGTGSFTNNTFATFTGTTNFSNVSKIINTTVGTTIQWRVYANDSTNNKNSTSIFSYITTASNCWSGSSEAGGMLSIPAGCLYHTP